jgi:hypothetical protein
MTAKRVYSLGFLLARLYFEKNGSLSPEDLL